mmetsp:Transcript_100188/g.323188  ORF Transcript_100188/g.323188 Transcript_100188/m.323188 type:complete len:292 (+) Transcript_100188:366-1241(+)
MIWWSTSSWSILSCERFRMTPAPSTTSPWRCSMAVRQVLLHPVPCVPSDICAMSKVSKASIGGILTWKAGGGEGLLSWPVGLDGLQSKALFCSAAACVGLLRRSRRSRCDQEVQFTETRQRCLPGYIQPGSCCRKSLGPSWWQISPWSHSSRGCSTAGAPSGAGPAASWRWITKDGSQTAEPVLGGLLEKRSIPRESIRDSMSGMRTQMFSHFRKAPNSLATSCLLCRRLPSHWAINVRTSASEAMGRSSCDRITSTSMMGSSCHLMSSVMEHRFLLCRRALMRFSLSFSW